MTEIDPQCPHCKSTTMVYASEVRIRNGVAETTEYECMCGTCFDPPAAPFEPWTDPEVFGSRTGRPRRLKPFCRHGHEFPAGKRECPPCRAKWRREHIERQRALKGVA